jgi:hypothetical protein
VGDKRFYSPIVLKLDPNTGIASYWAASEVVATFNVTMDGLFDIAWHTASSSMYITNSVLHTVIKVTAAGVVSTVAGNGSAGYSGDGGPATSAMLNLPTHLEVDAVGNVYIVDASNHVIRKVDSNGIITTVAGSWWPEVVPRNITLFLEEKIIYNNSDVISRSLYYPSALAIHPLTSALHFTDGITGKINLDASRRRLHCAKQYLDLEGGGWPLPAGREDALAREWQLPRYHQHRL